MIIQMLDWCRPTNRVLPAAAAQTYRMQAKQQEKLELESLLEQVLWHRASVYISLSTKSTEPISAVVTGVVHADARTAS